MWTPTHVQITVHRARNLIPKGKNGTNDAYVTIGLGKEKYQTSVKEKAEGPEWHEECDLPIPSMENSIILNCFHRNLLGLDEFLGHVNIPLEQFQIYERPKSRWYALKNKPGAFKKEKYRGEIEVRVLFTVKNVPSNDRRMSLQSMSLGEKIHSKMERKRSKQDLGSDCDSPISQVSKHELLKPSKSSPGKLEKKRRSVSHEVLATTPSFGVASTTSPFASPINDDSHADNSSIDSRDSASTSSTSHSRDSSSNNITPKKHVAPPKPPRTLLRERSSPDSGEILTQSNTELNSDVSVTKLQGSPKQYRSQENIADNEKGIADNNIIKTPSETPTVPCAKDTTGNLINSDHSLDRSEIHDRSGEEEDHFSRTNSFRQAIQRGSMRKSGGRKGSFVDQQKATRGQNDLQQSPLLTAVRRSYTDSNPSIDTLPEETSTPLSTPNNDTKQQHKSSHLTVESTNMSTSNEQLDTTKNVLKSKSSPLLDHANQRPKSETSDAKSSPRTSVKQSKLDPSRRHTLGYGMKEIPSVTTHEIQETIDNTKTIAEQDKKQTLPNEVLDQFKDMDREDLIKIILTQRKDVYEKVQYSKDLEEYIDNLLVRVLEVQPKILQTPFPSPYMGSHYNRTQAISAGITLGINRDIGSGGISGSRTVQYYPPPAYSTNNTVVQNNNRNITQNSQQQPSSGGIRQQNSYNSRSRISPPKLIRAGQNNIKKEKKSSNPFKKFLKN